MLVGWFQRDIAVVIVPCEPFAIWPTGSGEPSATNSVIVAVSPTRLTLLRTPVTCLPPNVFSGAGVYGPDISSSSTKDLNRTASAMTPYAPLGALTKNQWLANLDDCAFVN